MFLSFACTCPISSTIVPCFERRKRKLWHAVEDEKLDAQMPHIMHMIRDQGGVEP